MISIVMDVLAKSFDFSGRATRKEYWVFSFLSAAVLAVVVWLEVNADHFDWEILMGPFSGLWMMAMILPMISVTVRRFHDVGMSGWWCLMVLVPLLGQFMQFVFMVTEGTYGPNEYGEDPLKRDAAVEGTQ